MSTAGHQWNQLHPSKGKVIKNHITGASVLQEKTDNITGVQDGSGNGIKRRRQMIIASSVTTSTIPSSKKASTIYKNGDLVNERYRVIKLLGTGTFGEVYHVADELQRGQEFALKVEKPRKVNKSFLEVEINIYSQIKGGVGIPKIRFFGSDNKAKSRILVMENLGPSLQEMLIKCGGTFSCDTTAMLADQMIERVEFLHYRNILHRDVKPDNFLLGRKGTVGDATPSYWKRTFGEEVYIIDFGVGKVYRDSAFNHIRPSKKGGSLTGTVRYTSIHSHSGHELSRRDDLESIAYVLVYFMKGKLPWQNQPGSTKVAKYANIRKIEMNTSPTELCKDLPPQFAKCVDYCRRLGFEEVPDYAYLRSLFRKLIADRKPGTPLAYDWNLINNPTM